jgi:hypothetical protein
MKRLVVLMSLLAPMVVAARLPIENFGKLPAALNDVQASVVLAFDVWTPPTDVADRLAGEVHITPEGFSVALYLSHVSGKSALQLWAMHRDGLSWWDVAARAGVPPSNIVVQPSRDYGPPYGKAWGYWKKGKKRRAIRLSDSEFAAMVRVHTLARATGLSPDAVMERLAAGRRYDGWAAEVCRERRHKRRKHERTGEKGPPGHQKEHGKGHGRDGR